MDVKLLYSITCVVHLHLSIGDSGIVTSSALWGFRRCPAGCFIIIGGGGGIFHHYWGRGGCFIIIGGDVSSLSEGSGGYFIIIGEGGMFHHYRGDISSLSKRR